LKVSLNNLKLIKQRQRVPPINPTHTLSKLFMKPKVLGIGEILWDLLPAGARMGGAPTNFACHAAALGADAAVISRVGADASGERLLARLAEMDVVTESVSVDLEHPTGTVEVALGADGQPEYTIRRDVAWDHLMVTPGLLCLAKAADAVCFGTLGQRSADSRHAIRQLVTATRPDAVRVFDVNLRQNYFNADILHESLQLANVLKLSDGELPVLAKQLGLGGSVREQLQTLVVRHELAWVVYTLGAKGSILCNISEWHSNPGVPTTIHDTIGAGDSFTAAVTMGLLYGWPADKISQLANEVAAHVCSFAGAVPVLPAHLRRSFQTSDSNVSAPRSADGEIHGRCPERVTA
jgi:fructokinase